MKFSVGDIVRRGHTYAGIGVIQESNDFTMTNQYRIGFLNHSILCHESELVLVESNLESN